MPVRSTPAGTPVADAAATPASERSPGQRRLCTAASMNLGWWLVHQRSGRSGETSTKQEIAAQSAAPELSWTAWWPASRGADGRAL